MSSKNEAIASVPVNDNEQTRKDRAKVIALLDSIDEQMDQLCKLDIMAALKNTTGQFVGLVESYAQHQGQNFHREMKINGMANRDITLHPTKTMSADQEAEH